MTTNRPLEPLTDIPGPVVIGAVGGSGTRIVSEILTNAGIDMGRHVDARTRDSLPMREFLEWGFEPLVARSFARSAELPERLAEGLLTAIKRHRRGMTAAAPWGWKNPRTMWLIPILARVFPDLRFILLARDGRDVALSDNRFLLKTAGSFLLAGESHPSEQHAQLALWEKGTRWALETGAEYLADRFYLLRYEDLCAAPRDALERLFTFLDRPEAAALAEQQAAHIRPSPGIGRGKDAAPVADIRGARELLRQLGYEA